MTVIQRLSPPLVHEALNTNKAAVLIDVRDPVEFAFVGHPVGAINIPLKFAPAMSPNPDFLSSVRERIPDLATPVYLLCRSGQRSMAAAEILVGAGYLEVVNIEEGFEGGIDDNKHRSTVSGWRFHKLPWVQS